MSGVGTGGLSSKDYLERQESAPDRSVVGSKPAATTQSTWNSSYGVTFSPASNNQTWRPSQGISFSRQRSAVSHMPVASTCRSSRGFSSITGQRIMEKPPVSTAKNPCPMPVIPALHNKHSFLMSEEDCSFGSDGDSMDKCEIITENGAAIDNSEHIPPTGTNPPRGALQDLAGQPLLTSLEATDSPPPVLLTYKKLKIPPKEKKPQRQKGIVETSSAASNIPSPSGKRLTTKKTSEVVASGTSRPITVNHDTREGPHWHSPHYIRSVYPHHDWSAQTVRESSMSKEYLVPPESTRSTQLPVSNSTVKSDYMHSSSHTYGSRIAGDLSVNIRAANHSKTGILDYDGTSKKCFGKTIRKDLRSLVPARVRAQYLQFDRVKYGYKQLLYQMRDLRDLSTKNSRQFTQLTCRKDWRDRCDEWLLRKAEFELRAHRYRAAVRNRQDVEATLAKQIPGSTSVRTIVRTYIEAQKWIDLNAMFQDSKAELLGTADALGDFQNRWGLRYWKKLRKGSNPRLRRSMPPGQLLYHIFVVPSELVELVNESYERIHVGLLASHINRTLKTLRELNLAMDRVSDYAPFKPVGRFIRQHPLELRHYLRAALFSVSRSLFDIENESVNAGENLVKENAASSASGNAPCLNPTPAMSVSIFKPDSQVKIHKDSSYAPFREKREKRSSSLEGSKPREVPQQSRLSPCSESSGVLKPLSQLSPITKQDAEKESFFRRSRGIREFSGTSQSPSNNCKIACSSTQTTDSIQRPIVGSRNDYRALDLTHVGHDSAVIQLAPGNISASIPCQTQGSTLSALPRSTNVLVQDEGTEIHVDLSPTTSPPSAAMQTKVPVTTSEKCSEIPASTGSPEHLSYSPKGFTMNRHEQASSVKEGSLLKPVYWSYTLYTGPNKEKVKVHYCKNRADTERIAQLFIGQEVVGFDIEWKPNAQAKDGTKKNISLIQLACEERVALFHVARYWEDGSADALVAPTFKAIMESPKITKVGVAIKGDCTRLRRFMAIESRGLFELSHLYKLVKYSDGKASSVNKVLVSLATQVEEHLGLPLWKGDARTSDWSLDLNLEQVQYAASDSYAGFQLFHTLEHKRMLLSPTPPRPHHAELNLPISLATGQSIETDDESDSVEEEPDQAGESPSVEELARDFLNIKSACPIVSTADPAKRSPRPSAQACKPEVVAANEWVAKWRATLPQDYKPAAAPACLRAHALWHEQGFTVPEVAALLRDPPLLDATVAGYVLDALRSERLPFEKERLAALLSYVPKAMKGRYQRFIEKAEVTVG